MTGSARVNGPSRPYPPRLPPQLIMFIENARRPRMSVTLGVCPLVSCLLLLVACLLPIATWPGEVCAQWPAYRGPAGDGSVSGNLARPAWQGDGPRALWKIETPLGFSSFAVAGGRAATLVARGGREVVLVVDADSGDEIWSAPLGVSDYDHDGGNAGAPGNRGGDGPRSTPVIDDQRVYVYDAHLVLSCFAAADGRLVWRRDIAGEFAGQNIKWFNATSPVIDGTRVLVGGGGPGQSLLAFDRQTGDLVWQVGDETITHATPTLATIAGRRQIVYFLQSGLVAVDVETGTESWRAAFPFSVSTAASPVVFRDLVYCSAGYGVGAGLFRAGAGREAEEVWFQPNELMNHWSTPIAHEGHLYGIFEFKKYGRAPLQCVDLESGQILWKREGFGPGNCILVGDQLVVLSDAGDLVIADASPEGYRERGRASLLRGKCWSTPAYSDGRLYIRSTEEGGCFPLSTVAE